MNMRKDIKSFRRAVKTAWEKIKIRLGIKPAHSVTIVY